jgi:hypothetical protein
MVYEHHNYRKYLYLSWLNYFLLVLSPSLDGRISPLLGLRPPTQGLHSCLSSEMRGLYALSDKRGLLRLLSSDTGVPPELVILGLFTRFTSPRLLVTMPSSISLLSARLTGVSNSNSFWNSFH